MPIAIRLLLLLVPKNEKTFTILLALLLLPVLMMMFVGSSATVLTHVPAIDAEKVEIYKEATFVIEERYNLNISWKELISLDAVRYNQDFSKVSLAKVVDLADRFVQEVKAKDDEGNTFYYFTLKSLDAVVNEMIAEGELQEGDLQRVKTYFNFPWEAITQTPSLPTDYIPIPGDEGFVFPVVGKWRVSDVFRERINPVTGVKERHAGLDLAAPEGTPVVAAKPGRVVFAGMNGSAGNEVKIDHQDGTVTRYLHLHSYSVSRGQEVDAGRAIGQVGNTGRSTGPHLHFEIHINGIPVNPASYILRER